MNAFISFHDIIKRKIGRPTKFNNGPGRFGMLAGVLQPYTAA
jgi:hypothetical protein